MSAYHEIGEIRFDGSRMTLDIDGNERTFELSEVSEVLASWRGAWP